jgi:hypothetical protein
MSTILISIFHSMLPGSAVKGRRSTLAARPLYLR